MLVLCALFLCQVLCALFLCWDGATAFYDDVLCVITPLSFWYLNLMRASSFPWLGSCDVAAPSGVTWGPGAEGWRHAPSASQVSQSSAEPAYTQRDQLAGVGGGEWPGGDGVLVGGVEHALGDAGLPVLHAHDHQQRLHHHRLALTATTTRWSALSHQLPLRLFIPNKLCEDSERVEQCIST